MIEEYAKMINYENIGSKKPINRRKRTNLC